MIKMPRVPITHAQAAEAFARGAIFYNGAGPRAVQIDPAWYASTYGVTTFPALVSMLMRDGRRASAWFL